MASPAVSVSAAVVDFTKWWDVWDTQVRVQKTEPFWILPIKSSTTNSNWPLPLSLSLPASEKKEFVADGALD